MPLKRSIPWSLWVVFSMALYSGAIALNPASAAYSLSELKNHVSDKEWKIVWVINQEIDELKKMVKSGSKRQKAQLIHRLSSLFQEKSSVLFRWENEYHDKLQKEGRTSRESADHGLSNKYLQTSMKLGQTVIKNFPKYADRQELLYYLGVQNERMGKKQKARQYFQAVLKNTNKDSPYYGEALVALGEGYFKDREFNKAKAYFASATEFRNTKSYTKSLYYLALTYYNVQQYSYGLRAIKKVIRLGDGGGKYPTYESEAIQFLPKFITAMRIPARKAVDFMAGFISRSDLFNVIGDLSEVYEERGSLQEVDYLQKTRYAYAANPSQRLEVLLENVELYERTGRLREMTQTLRQASLQFALGKGSGKSKSISPGLQEKLMVKVRNTSSKFHQNAQKKRDPKYQDFLLTLAQTLYQVYLKHWPKASDRHEVKFYLADVFFLKGDKIMAAKIYHQLLIPEVKTRGIRKDSATRQLVSLEEALEESRAPEQVKWIRGRLLVASDQFAKEHPNHKNLPVIRLKAAETAMAMNDQREAIRRYSALVKLHREKPQAKVAAERVLTIFENQKNWTELANYAQNFIGLTKNAQNKSFVSRLQEIYVRGHFKIGESLQSKGQYLKAAKKFETIADYTQSTQVRYNALQKAASNFDLSGRFKGFERVALKLFKQFPKDSGVQDRWIEVAENRFSEGRFQEAARAYWDFYQRHEDGRAKIKRSKVLSALYNSFQIWNAIDDRPQRDIAAQSLVEKYPSSTQAIDSTFYLAKEWREANRHGDVAKILESYLRNNPKHRRRVEAHLLLGKTFQKIDYYDKSNEHFQLAVNEFQKLPSSRKSPEIADFAAEAKFELSDDLLAKFKKKKIRTDAPDVVPQDIKNKVAQLDRLTKRYSQLISFGSAEWGLISFSYLANAYLHFSGELKEISLPLASGDPSRQIAANSKPFEQQGEQVRGEAVNYLQNGLRLGRDLEVISPFMANLWNQISEIQPKRYPPLQLRNWGGDRAILMDPLQ